jgi:hypothetical protein
VAGVAAILFEANPWLSPTEATRVLTATADLPQGASYETTGRALGHGVVDASQAVAVALRLADGLEFGAALAQATVNATSRPVRLNAAGDVSSPHHAIPYDVPAAGADGWFQKQYPPDASPVATIADVRVLVPGDRAWLMSAGIVANAQGPRLDPDTIVHHSITAGGNIIHGPVKATLIDDGAMLFAYSEWDVPAGAGSSTYVLRSVVVENGIPFLLHETGITVVDMSLRIGPGKPDPNGMPIVR